MVTVKLHMCPGSGEKAICCLNKQMFVTNERKHMSSHRLTAVTVMTGNFIVKYSENKTGKIICILSLAPIKFKLQH
jgi:short-subunit dehydrogenase